MDDLTVTEETSDSSSEVERPKPGYIRINGEVYRITRHAGKREFCKEKLELYNWG